MEDTAVEEAEVSGAAEFAPANVAAPPFGHSVAVARPPTARCLDESCPPREFTAEKEVASSSSSSEKAPIREAPPVDPAAPTQAAKKKKQKKMKRVIMPQSYLESVMKIEESEPLSPLHEKWLKRLTALIPNREQFLADSGLSPEKYRGLDNMEFLVNVHTDMVAVLQEQLREKGYVEVEVTDDEEEEEGRRVPNLGRRRFRPGVCKTSGGEIRRLYY